MAPIGEDQTRQGVSNCRVMLSLREEQSHGTISIVVLRRLDRGQLSIDQTKAGGVVNPHRGSGNDARAECRVIIESGGDYHAAEAPAAASHGLRRYR